MKVNLRDNEKLKNIKKEKQFYNKFSYYISENSGKQKL